MVASDWSVYLIALTCDIASDVPARQEPRSKTENLGYGCRMDTDTRKRTSVHIWLAHQVQYFSRMC